MLPAGALMAHAASVVGECPRWMAGAVLLLCADAVCSVMMGSSLPDWTVSDTTGHTLANGAVYVPAVASPGTTIMVLDTFRPKRGFASVFSKEIMVILLVRFGTVKPPVELPP